MKTFIRYCCSAYIFTGWGLYAVVEILWYARGCVHAWPDFFGIILWTIIFGLLVTPFLCVTTLGLTYPAMKLHERLEA